MNQLNEEEIVEKLADFGLTVNQAMVFLSVVRSRITTVDRISQDTKLYRQDIYKMMPKLQRMGLVTKIIGKPAQFEALPVETALKNLLASEREKAEERILRLSGNLQAVTAVVTRHQTRKSPGEKTPSFSLLTHDFELKNKFDESFEKARKEFCIVTTAKLAPQIIRIINERIKTLAKRGLVTRVIIESSVDATTRTFLDKLDRAHDCLIAKQVSDATLIPYRIFDDNEVWITLKKETDSGFPWFLWTDATNVVKFYKKNFESLWASPAAKSL